MQDFNIYEELYFNDQHYLGEFPGLKKMVSVPKEFLSTRKYAAVSAEFIIWAAIIFSNFKKSETVLRSLLRNALQILQSLVGAITLICTPLYQILACFRFPSFQPNQLPIMKGAVVLFPSASALPRFPLRLATQVSRYLNVIRSPRHDAGGFRLQEGCWKSKDGLALCTKSQVPATAHTQRD